MLYSRNYLYYKQIFRI